MLELGTTYPYGLNDRLQHVGNVSHSCVRSRNNVFNLFNRHQRRKRSHGRRSNSRRNSQIAICTTEIIFSVRTGIDSTAKPPRRFIKVFFHNKRMDKVKLTNILHNKLEEDPLLPHGHVITGDLRIIRNRKLRRLLEKRQSTGSRIISIGTLTRRY
ncbi:unnamed protein product [Porites evermanni]|uniref:Uncharacterized protein n=1 Tax=Porites evermanni TaxID=104178 RepID=A0ABN8PEY0_9CNID|nr:unnamed protein product [Porites evermanni]